MTKVEKSEELARSYVLQFWECNKINRKDQQPTVLIYKKRMLIHNKQVLDRQDHRIL